MYCLHPLFQCKSREGRRSKRGLCKIRTNLSKEESGTFQLQHKKSNSQMSPGKKMVRARQERCSHSPLSFPHIWRRQEDICKAPLGPEWTSGAGCACEPSNHSEEQRAHLRWVPGTAWGHSVEAEFYQGQHLFPSRYQDISTQASLDQLWGVMRWAV